MSNKLNYYNSNYPDTDYSGSNYSSSNSLGSNFSCENHSGRSRYSDIGYYEPRHQNSRNDEYDYYERAAYYNEYDSRGKNSSSDSAKNNFNEAAEKFGSMTVTELANSTVFMIVAYLLCWPFALFLMWKYSRWSQTLKIVLTIIFGLFGLGIIIKLIGIFGAFSLFL